ncbi:MAG: hypothetical protein JO066_09385 [Verrucomicrobia bacterium]|nr:hypothetical protein [Verrucomicrobiota bacterium]
MQNSAELPPSVMQNSMPLPGQPARRGKENQQEYSKNAVHRVNLCLG